MGQSGLATLFIITVSCAMTACHACRRCFAVRNVYGSVSARRQVSSSPSRQASRREMRILVEMQPTTTVSVA